MIISEKFLLHSLRYKIIYKKDSTSKYVTSKHI